MTEKTPALLAVVVRTETRQWYVAGINLDGTVLPLVRSKPDNLDQYVGQPDDEQLSFLRHRLSGAMQRGCDRLWAHQAKAARIVLIVDDHIKDADEQLLPRLADHFHTWMTRPPVTCYRGNGEATIADLASLECLVDPPDQEQLAALDSGLRQLASVMADEGEWEVIKKPRA